MQYMVGYSSSTVTVGKATMYVNDVCEPWPLFSSYIPLRLLLGLAIEAVLRQWLRRVSLKV